MGGTDRQTHTIRGEGKGRDPRGAKRAQTDSQPRAGSRGTDKGKGSGSREKTPKGQGPKGQTAGPGLGDGHTQ